jgi:hypothetical protein
MICRVCKNTNKEWAVRYIDTETATCMECSAKRKTKDYCEHGKRYHDCRTCVDGRIISAQNWYKVVKQDKIDDFTINDLIEMANRGDKCYYPFCSKPLQYDNPHVDDFATLERLNNNIRHTKENCVVACWRCNVVERVSYRQTHL